MPAKKQAHSKSSTTPKSTHAKKESTRAANDAWPELPLELQQSILNTFTHSLHTQRNPNALSAHVQEVKHHLYEREFLTAFGSESFRGAYALRWSPGRALAYANVFCHLDPLRLKSLDQRRGGNDAVDVESVDATAQQHRRTTAPRKEVVVVCVGGGGGAELVGLAAYLRGFRRAGGGGGGAGGAGGAEAGDSPPAPGRFEREEGFRCMIVDVADWSCVTEKLAATLRGGGSSDGERSGLEAQSTAAAAAATTTTVCTGGHVSSEFRQLDVLGMEAEGMLWSAFHAAALVTVMFTLNELYSASVGRTTGFLLALTDVLEAGSLLLVIDSPGSYSTVGLGRDGVEKRYPMQWLLDRTLLDSASVPGGNGKDRVARWEKVQSHDSRWFRRAKGLRYPIELEDMRYQMHLYRRI